MITLTRNIIKKINRNLVGFKSEVEVGFDKQSNDRILLDIAIKLYDDEVFRYRYIEDKALKIATIVIFIATTLTALITWMATRDIGMVGQLINFGFSLSAIFVIACLLYVYEVLSENDESLSAISLSDLDINNISDSSKYCDDFYETLLSKYSERIVDYKYINAKKQTVLIALIGIWVIYCYI